jgi:rsbT co-antagonist protein RsbR
MPDVSTSSSLDTADAAALLSRFRITDSDLALVKKFGVKITPNLEDYIEEFYKWLTPQPFFSLFFPDERRVEVTKAAQVEYMRQFFTADIDDAYVESRREIGKVHARVELPLDIYMAGVSINFENCVEILESGGKPTQQSQRTLLAISKLMHFDATITAETYAQITRESVIEQSKSLIEMSTPVTAIWEGILLLPLVGVIDSKRALDITARVLEEIANSQSSVLILDISGVAIIDTAVANYLIKITKATRLMGCESLISGLSPAIAQTIVDLGIDVGTIQTTGNLRDALRLAFASVGLTVSEQ